MGYDFIVCTPQHSFSSESGTTIERIVTVRSEDGTVHVRCKYG